MNDVVIVGVDGSFAGLRAARWAAAIAERIAAPLKIVHVVDGAERQPSEAVLRSAEDAVRAYFKTLRITSALVDGSAARALIALSVTARLIVLGTDESQTESSLLAGSTTTTVVANSICPVVVWRGVAMSPTQQPIVVGVDHDQDSRVAIAAAFEFANRLAVKIIAVHAWTASAGGDVSLPSITFWDQIESDARQHLSGTLMPWLDLYPDADVTEVVDSDKPGRALLRYARSAQLLAVGSRARGLDVGIRLGSIGLELLRNATLPVMFCHSVEGAADQTEAEW